MFQHFFGGLKNVYSGVTKITAGISLLSVGTAVGVGSGGVGTAITVGSYVVGGGIIANGWVQASVGVAEMVAGAFGDEEYAHRVKQIGDMYYEYDANENSNVIIDVYNFDTGEHLSRSQYVKEDTVNED